MLQKKIYEDMYCFIHVLPLKKGRNTQDYTYPFPHLHAVDPDSPTDVMKQLAYYHI